MSKLYTVPYNRRAMYVSNTSIIRLGHNNGVYKAYFLLSNTVLTTTPDVRTLYL